MADDVATKQVDLDGADFVIFSSIMSELCALDGSQAISANVNRILGTMRSGTRILFVDNLWTDCIKYFKICKGYNGLEKNEDVKPVHFELPNWPPTFASFAAALGRLPRMGSDKMISKWYIKS